MTVQNRPVGGNAEVCILHVLPTHQSTESASSCATPNPSQTHPWPRSVRDMGRTLRSLGQILHPAPRSQKYLSRLAAWRETHLVAQADPEGRTKGAGLFRLEKQRRRKT